MSELVGLEDLAQLKEIMEDEFDMLISMFIEDSGILVNTMKTSTTSQDAEALRIAAHTLKGSSSNMCVMSLADICKQIEDKAKDSDFSGMDTLVADLDSLYPQVSQILKDF